MHNARALPPVCTG